MRNIRGLYFGSWPIVDLVFEIIFLSNCLFAKIFKNTGVPGLPSCF